MIISKRRCNALEKSTNRASWICNVIMPFSLDPETVIFLIIYFSTISNVNLALEPFLDHWVRFSIAVSVSHVVFFSSMYFTKWTWTFGEEMNFVWFILFAYVLFTILILIIIALMNFVKMTLMTSDNPFDHFKWSLINKTWAGHLCPYFSCVFTYYRETLLSLGVFNIF